MKVQNESFKTNVIIKCLLICININMIVDCFQQFYWPVPGFTFPTNINPFTEILLTATAIPTVDVSEITDENDWPLVNCTDCQFSCLSKRLCVEPHLVCDEINDCDDGSDEFFCSDEYLKFNPVHPNDDQYKNGCCLRSIFNDKVCTKKMEPFLIFSRSDNLYKVDLSEHSSERRVKKVLTGNSNNQISSFEYRTHDNLLIWLDPIENKIFTGKVNLEQMFPSSIFDRKVVVSTEHKIHGFVYDPLNPAIIWIDDYGVQSERIYLHNFTARNQTKTYRILEPYQPYQSGDIPRSIAIDNFQEFVFWTEFDYASGCKYQPCYIEQINLRSKYETNRIICEIIHPPIGSVVDTDYLRLYWIDSITYTLHQVSYLETYASITYKIIEPIVNFHGFLSMDIYSNDLYYEAYDSIYRINLYNVFSEDDKLISWQPKTKIFFKIIDPINQRHQDFSMAARVFEEYNQR